jgi:hypothetical protein
VWYMGSRGLGSLGLREVVAEMANNSNERQFR